MSKINDGGAAFPSLTIVPLGGGMAGPHPGMSLRDWFAGQALPTVMAVCVTSECAPGETLPQMFARKSYRVADAMIAARAAAPPARESGRAE